MACVTGPEICRSRGDSEPIKLTLKDSSGDAIDVVGRTFSLTVDPSDEPADAVNNLFTLTGVIVAPATDGRVDFAITTVEADQTPDTYFYDVQQTLAGNIQTIAKGKFIFQQDITK